jgi:hypothetical protein
MNFQTLLATSCKTAQKKWKQLMNLFFIDGFYVIISLIGLAWFTEKLTKAVLNLSFFMAQYGNAGTQDALMEQLGQFPMTEFNQMFIQGMTALFSLMLFLLLMWCMFQSFTWWKVHKLLGNKMEFTVYARNFFGVSFGISILYAIIIFLWGVISFDVVQLGDSMFFLVFILLGMLADYSGLTAYSIPETNFKKLMKKTYKAMWKKKHLFLSLYLSFAAVFFILYTCMKWLGWSNPFMVSGIAFIVTLLALSYFRVAFVMAGKQ